MYDCVSDLRNNIDTIVGLLRSYYSEKEIKSTHSNSQDMEKFGFIKERQRNILNISPVGLVYCETQETLEREAIKRIQILFYCVEDIYPFWILLKLLYENRELTRENVNNIMDIPVEEIREYLEGRKRITLSNKSFSKDKTEMYTYIANFMVNTGFVSSEKEGRRLSKLVLREDKNKFIQRILRRYPTINKKTNETLYRELYQSDGLEEKIDKFLMGVDQ